MILRSKRLRPHTGILPIEPEANKVDLIFLVLSRGRRRNSKKELFSR